MAIIVDNDIDTVPYFKMDRIMDTLSLSPYGNRIVKIGYTVVFIWKGFMSML